MIKFGSILYDKEEKEIKKNRDGVIYRIYLRKQK